MLYLVVVVLVPWPCLTLCDPVDCSPPGFSPCGISQARILKWLPFPSPEDLSDPSIKPAGPAFQAASCIGRWILYYKPVLVADHFGL